MSAKLVRSDSLNRGPRRVPPEHCSKLAGVNTRYGTQPGFFSKNHLVYLLYRSVPRMQKVYGAAAACRTNAGMLLSSCRWISAREQLKEYVFPEIKNEDCEQKYISGWGPGGQCVNTSQNACMLRHVPTGIVLKVHDSRLLQKNIQIAFERMKFAVDKKLNGPNCYEEQLRKLEKMKEEQRERKKAAARRIKEELKAQRLKEESGKAT